MIKEKQIKMYLLIPLIIGILIPFYTYQADYKFPVEYGYMCILISFFIIVASIGYHIKVQKNFDTFSPFVIPNILFVFIYILKPLYIIFTGEVGVGEFDVHPITDVEIRAFNKANLYCLISIFIYNITLHFFLSSRPHSYFNKGKMHFKEKMFWLGKSKVLNVIAIISICFTFGIITFLFARAGGITNYLDSLALRNIYLKDLGYMLMIANMSKLVLFVYTAKILTQKSHSRKDLLIWLVLLVSSIAFLLLTGGRSSILYGIMTLCIMWHYLKRQIKFAKSMLAGGILFFFIVIVYRVVLRDKYFKANDDLSTFTILINAIEDFPRYFFGGYDVIQFDALLTLLANKAQYTFLYGETLLAALLSPIPRDIYPEKGHGAMTLFTKTFFPQFYYPNNVEVNVSYVGEMYLNFGLLGIIVGMVILSSILGIMYKKFIVNRSIIAFFIYSITIVRVISLIRGDVFNFTIYYIQDIVPITFMLLLLGWRRKKSVNQSMDRMNINANFKC
ncbi:O-antigen polymerase [Bacillus luti]